MEKSHYICKYTSFLSFNKLISLNLEVHKLILILKIRKEVVCSRIPEKPVFRIGTYKPCWGQWPWKAEEPPTQALALLLTAPGGVGHLHPEECSPGRGAACRSVLREEGKHVSTSHDVESEGRGCCGTLVIFLLGTSSEAWSALLLEQDFLLQEYVQRHQLIKGCFTIRVQSVEAAI